MFEQQRVQAYETAIAAIRQYIERPTNVNAIEVEAAWQALRKLEALAAWRQPCATHSQKQ